MKTLICLVITTICLWGFTPKSSTYEIIDITPGKSVISCNLFGNFELVDGRTGVSAHLSAKYILGLTDKPVILTTQINNFGLESITTID